jgi:hypothetical protein
VIPAVLAAAAGVASRTYKELCLMDDLGKLHIQQSSHICRKILDDARTEGEDNILDNINEHIPDDYGYCDDCSRVDPDSGDYGYCPDCDQCYTSEDIDQIKEDAKEDQYNDIVSQITRGEVNDSKLLEAMNEWTKLKGGK